MRIDPEGCGRVCAFVVAGTGVGSQSSTILSSWVPTIIGSSGESPITDKLKLGARESEV